MTINLSSSSRYHRLSLKQGTLLTEGESGELVNALQAILQNVGTLLEVESCSVALLDGERNRLETRAIFQKQKQEHKRGHIRFPKSNAVGSWVVEHREALIIKDVSVDPRFKDMEPPLAGSIACVPLIDKDIAIGTLAASSPETDAFSQHKLHLLTIFAEQAVLTIINARQAELARRDATRMKANFLSMITHALRSPLNTINGYLDLALEGIGGELNEQQHEFVQRARAGSEHLYALVEDLLLVSRADAGQLRLSRELISLPVIIANAVEELELIALDNGVTIQIDIASDFPSIYADAVRMQQVLRNLISNALRFTPAGGCITISARVINKAGDATSTASTVSDEVQRLVEVQVRDTGYGIAAEYQEQIFERFYQVPLTDAGLSSGQGLGLAIVKMIVELHGGGVAVESLPGAGSTFKFTLPLLLTK